MPGPPPKDPAQRRRRNSSGAQKTLLPAGGRGKRNAPVWPLASAKPACWPGLWKMPQAVVWERDHLVRVVARYAVLLEQAEQPGAPVFVLAETRQLEDRLGLSPKAMRSLLWEVTSDEVGEQRAERAAPVVVPVTAAESARGRLKVV